MPGAVVKHDWELVAIIIIETVDIEQQKVGVQKGIHRSDEMIIFLEFFFFFFGGGGGWLAVCASVHLSLMRMSDAFHCSSSAPV